MWILLCTLMLLATLVGSASYGPDLRIQSEGISGGYIKQFVPKMGHRYLMWLDVVVCYLMYTFFIALTEMNTAYSTCSWFFTRKKESAFMPGPGAMMTVGRYHLGTVSKLSIYKLLFKMPRDFVAVLKSSLRSAKQDNNIVRFMMATFLPLITLYERFMKFITKDMLVITAMWGDEYEVASRKDFFMVKFRHPGDGYAILGWTSFVLLTIKLSISLFMGVLCYLYCYFLNTSPLRYDMTPLDTPIVPYIVMFATSTFITSIWICPYDMMLRAIIQCYSMDGEKYIDKIAEVNQHIKNDKTFFCFACKKKTQALKPGQTEGGAEWTEDLEELKEEEEEAMDDLDDEGDYEEDEEARRSPAKERKRGKGQEMDEGDQGAFFDDEDEERIDALANTNSNQFKFETDKPDAKPSAKRLVDEDEDDPFNQKPKAAGPRDQLKKGSGVKGMPIMKGMSNGKASDERPEDVRSLKDRVQVGPTQEEIEKRKREEDRADNISMKSKVKQGGNRDTKMSLDDDKSSMKSRIKIPTKKDKEEDKNDDLRSVKSRLKIPLGNLSKADNKVDDDRVSMRSKINIKSQNKPTQDKTKKNDMDVGAQWEDDDFEFN